MKTLDDRLAEFISSRTIPIFGIANAEEGFHHALPGWHPKDLMPRCKSLIVIGHPFLVYPLNIAERTYIADGAWWDANRIVYNQVAAWKRDLFGFLDGLGWGVAGFGGYWSTMEPTFSYRLAQVEAGIGVFGRSGVCINPEYGCYYYVGVLLTDAPLNPSDRTHLQGFNPCADCRACVNVCPIKAIDGSLEPGAGYDRERCARFVMKMSERSGTRAKICCHCYNVCPWSMGRLGTKRTFGNTREV